MDITITLTASNELMEVLKKIAGNFSGNGKSNAVEKPVISDAGAEQVSEAKAITLEQIRKAVTEKSQSGKKEKIKAVLKEFGVANVTALNKADYQKFLNEIENL